MMHGLILNKSAFLFAETSKTKILIILPTCAHTYYKLGYISGEQLHVSANHVAIFRDIKYKV
jgi:hypothetical protein